MDPSASCMEVSGGRTEELPSFSGAVSEGCPGSLLGPGKCLVRQRRSFETTSPGRARSNKKRRCLIPIAEEVQQRPEQSRRTNISDLPNEVLIKVFGCLDIQLHRFVLPLVCRQWQDLLASPLGIWNHLDIDFAAEDEEIIPGSYTKNANKIRESRVLQWVQPRAAAVKSLRLRGSVDTKARREVIESAFTLQSPSNWGDFTGNGMAKLFLTVATSLEELVIEYCHPMLTTITFTAMSRLSNLTVLCLKGICAALSESDFSAIAGLDHLQELVLDCEQPPELENGAEEIKWGLQDFPEGMLHLTNMTHLTLTCHYGITELPETLSKLSKLEVLNLDFCTLTKLPASLGKLTALTTLDVEGNMYLGDSYRENAINVSAQPQFPLQLAGLKALRYLNLNSCELSAVPEVVSSMTALETLDLENNNLGLASSPEGGMPAELVALTRLQCLNLTQNKLAKIPDVVVKFNSLRILDLTNNSLTDEGIPVNLRELGNLRAIGLKRNNLTAVPAVLGSVQSLQEIYLENNPSLEVSKSLDYVANLPNLRVLMLGKQSGAWEPSSMFYIADLTAKLKIRYPEKDILRISFPGHEPGALPDDAYEMLM